MLLTIAYIIVASFYIPSVATDIGSHPLSNQGNYVSLSSNPQQTAWIGSAITAGASLLGGLIGNNSQRKAVKEQIRSQELENQRNREYNLMLAQQQNAWNQEQWERENEYNTPANQMKRFKEAGLNPDLMAGAGATNLSAASPAMTSGAPSQPQDMSALGRRPNFGEALQAALRDSMIGAQIDNIKADTEKKRNESSILASDAKFRDAYNQGVLNLQNMQIRVDSSQLKLNDEEMMKLRAEVSKLDAETTNIFAEYGKIKALIRNLDADTASKRLHDALDSAKVEAEIKKLAASAGLDYANTKRVVTLLSAELAGLQASTAESWANVTLKGAEQVQIEATTESIRFDLSQAKSWSDIERGTGVYGKIMQGLTPIANLIGIAIGSGALRGKSNPIGFRR